MRLLDRALAAHGRDHGGPGEEWRARVVITAAAAAAFLDRDREPARGPLPAALERGGGIADALVALPRDRITVPGYLAEAAGEFLVVFAATTQ